jgi:exodeoxyribonuclease-5
MELSNQQEKVFRELIKSIKSINTGSGSKKILFGYAGTGKTTIASLLRKEFPDLLFAFLAYTGKAASVLRKTLNDKDCLNDKDYIGTIHSFIYKPIVKFNPKTRKDELIGWELKTSENNIFDVIVVDESSMIDDTTLLHLNSFCKDSFMLYMGDPFQLDPVQGKQASLRHPDYILTEIHRQALDNPIIRISKYIRSNDYTDLDYGKYGDNFYKIKINDYTDIVDKFDLTKQDIICLTYTNKSRTSLNELVRKKRNFILNEPYPSEKLICLANNRNIGIYNGEMGNVIYSIYKEKDILETVVVFDDKTLHLDISSDLFNSKQKLTVDEIQTIRKNKSKKNEGKVTFFDYGYAITVHKSQGSAWDKVILLDMKDFYFRERISYQKWLYTGITRSREKLLILSDK